MGKRLILGTRPEVDPLKDLSESSLSISSSTEINWNERLQGHSLARPLFLCLICTAFGLYSPFAVLAAGMIILAMVWFVNRSEAGKERVITGIESWKRVARADTSYSIADDIEGLDCSTPTGKCHVFGMNLGAAKSILLGDISAFVRAVDGSCGFSLTVTMKPENIQRAMDEERISDTIEDYLNTLPKGEVEAYVLRRGGIWLSHATAIGHLKSPADGDIFDSEVRASIPMEKWKRIKPRSMLMGITQVAIDDNSNWFYAAGTELSEWLVQLRSELASEVGTNVPGQFIAPIRGRANDYHLGVTVNPDTMRIGPPVGLSHADLENGVLICGGTSESRMRVIALLAARLLNAEKRVIILTNGKKSLGFTRLSEGAVHLELGKDLVLNPVDSEGIPRSEYVPLLISSLEPVAGVDLRGSTDLELAVMRAVTLGNATLADVQLSNSLEEVTTSAPASSKPPESSPSNKSKTGMEAIRSLHQGPAAKAFYGTQSVSTSRLVESTLTVVSVHLGSTSLEHFAWNLLSIKLAGLQADPSLVVILDSPENFRVRNRRFATQDSFSERLLGTLKKRGPIVLALEHPVDLFPGAIGTLSSCISLRLREASDIKVASDLLGLNVITTGMHTKARISPRESSFLRVMDDDTALLVHDGTETCQPVRLDPEPDLDSQSTAETGSKRISALWPSQNEVNESGEESLLDRVSAGNTALATRVLKLLERYEPLTQEAVRRFIISSGANDDPDIEVVLARLEHASMILRGHEVHSGVSYTNYRITMKGSMALRQLELTGRAIA